MGLRQEKELVRIKNAFKHFDEEGGGLLTYVRKYLWHVDAAEIQPHNTLPSKISISVNLDELR
jgi:hypothetical protein